MLALRSEMSSDSSSITSLEPRDKTLALDSPGIVEKSGASAAAMLAEALFDTAENVISALHFFEVNVVCA